MPYTEAVKQEMERRLPPADETRDRLLTYIQRSDMTRRQFATLCGYSANAIQAFLSGTYVQRATTDLPIRDAIESAIRRHPVGEVVTESAGRMYETENTLDLRRWFEHCHRSRALAFCYGPPGSQKTFVLKHLVAEFNRRELRVKTSRNRAYYVRASVNIQPRDMVSKMCTEAGATGGFSLQRCFSGLRTHLRNTQTLFVLDEAQMLNIPTLEAVRELNDEEPHIGVLLAGSHGLKRIFDRHAAELEQWNSRMDAGIELTGVSPDRAAGIINAELPGLSKADVNDLIGRSRVPDIYSRNNTTYLNVRRLFKNINALRDALASQREMSENHLASQPTNGGVQ